MADKPLLVLIDGMALAYRGHFALIKNPRSTAGGFITSSIFVFTSTVLKLIEEYKPTHVAVAFDTKAPTERHRIFPEYKANRDAMPEELVAQLPFLDQVCAALNIPVLKIDGYEADDVIGTLAKQGGAADFDVLMVTPDKDYAQLVDERVRMYKPGRKGDEATILGVAEVCEDWGVERVDQVIDVLGLMGDTSDNIPGVPGIGPKTAKQLIEKYGSTEVLYEHLHELKGKRKENLETYRDQAMLSKKLVTIDVAVPLDQKPGDFARQEPNKEAVAALFAELEFRTLGKRVLGEDFEPDAQEEEQPSTIADVFHDYQVITTAEQLADVTKQLASQSAFCFDVETTGVNARHDDLLGVALSWKAHEAYYIAVDAASAQEFLAPLAPIFANDAVMKIGHNLKFDIAVVQRYGLKVRGPLFDTLIAAFLVMPDRKRSMDALSEQLLNYKPIAISSLIGDKGDDQKTLAELPLEQVGEYAAEDADVTWQLYEELQPLIAEHGAEKVFAEVECPLIPVLVAMEGTGIKVAAHDLQQLSEELGEQIELLAQSAVEIAGREFNLKSPKQLGEILFDELQLDPYAKKTKTGQYQTSEQVLVRLAERHELPRVILDYRALTKLKSTYLDALPEYVEDDGRIHTHYEQAVAATGRMASHNPNLQNIPIRSDRGREVRRAFVASDDDHVLLSADYSQVELRISAEMSGDAGLREAFASGLDIHTATAMRAFHVDEHQVTADLRRRAKTVNFGILYGISAFGLSQRLDIPRGEAKELIDAYYAGFPQLREWLDNVAEEAKDKGYVETLSGRRRYLPDIESRNRAIRQAAERTAINAPVQGTAADLIKLAMVKLYGELETRGLKSRLLLQVHDELVLDVLKTELDEVRDLVIDCMANAIPMATPLDVEVGVGPTWYDAH